MTCTEAEELLNAALAGELDDRAPLDAHVASCADCRRTREALASQDRELDAAFAPLRAANDAVAARIIAARRPRVGRWLFAAAAAAAVLIAVFVLQPRAPVAVLVRATGPVQVNGAPALPGGTLREGDRIRTGDSATCELSWTDGTLVRLNAATEVQCRPDRQVLLQEGELFTRVPTDRPPLRIRSGKETILAQDSAINLSQRPLVASVIEGRARLGEEDIHAPMSCESAMNGFTRGKSVDPLLQTSWMHDLLKLKGGEDPELRQRVTALLEKIDAARPPSPHEAEIRGFGALGVPALLAVASAPPTVRGDPERRHAARLLSELSGQADRSALVPLTRDRDSEVCSWAVKGLRRLTGVDLTTSDEWQRWLDAPHPRK